MAVIISFANQKGGVGKTTSTVNVGHWLALHKYKTLLLDLDGQGHVGPALGLQKGDGLYRFAVHELPINDVVISARERLDIVPNDHKCELVKEHFKLINFREYILDTLLDDARSLYDFILIDTPPSTDILHVLALVASDYVIVPAAMDFLALDGVSYILKTVGTLSRYPGVKPPGLVGILPTLFDVTTNETMNNVLQLKAAIGEDLILPPIPRDTKVREATSRGLSIWEHAPKTNAAIGIENSSSLRNSAARSGGYLHLAEILTGLLKGKTI